MFHRHKLYQWMANTDDWCLSSDAEQRAHSFRNSSVPFAFLTLLFSSDSSWTRLLGRIFVFDLINTTSSFHRQSSSSLLITSIHHHLERCQTKLRSIPKQDRAMNIMTLTNMIGGIWKFSQIIGHCFHFPISVSKKSTKIYDLNFINFCSWVSNWIGTFKTWTFTIRSSLGKIVNKFISLKIVLKSIQGYDNFMFKIENELLNFDQQSFFTWLCLTKKIRKMESYSQDVFQTQISFQIQVWRVGILINEKKKKWIQ